MVAHYLLVSHENRTRTSTRSIAVDDKSSHACFLRKVLLQSVLFSTKGFVLTMLCAKRKSDGQTVIANTKSKTKASFFCPECEKEVVLRRGTVRVNHFAHRIPDSCRYLLSL